MQKLVEKVEHYKIFWENAELNCRLERRPLPDETDDGSFTGFEYSLSALRSNLTRIIQIQLPPGRNKIRNEFSN